MAAVGRLRRRFGRGPVNVGSWHVRDVTPAATRAAAIKGGAAIPARSPFMLRPRCRTLRALSCSDPNMSISPSRAARTSSSMAAKRGFCRIPTLLGGAARRRAPHSESSAMYLIASAAIRSIRALIAPDCAGTFGGAFRFAFETSTLRLYPNINRIIAVNARPPLKQHLRGTRAAPHQICS